MRQKHICWAKTGTPFVVRASYGSIGANHTHTHPAQSPGHSVAQGVLLYHTCGYGRSTAVCTLLSAWPYCISLENGTRTAAEMYSLGSVSTNLNVLPISAKKCGQSGGGG